MATFTVSNATLRVGTLFEGRPPFAYFAVTIENGDLVLARYSRRDRVVLRRVRAIRLRTGAVHTIKVTRSHSQVRAKIWRPHGNPRAGA